MNPFDIKAALLAKHAQHVVLIHFPTALFIAGVISDFLAQSSKRTALAAVAYYNSLAAAISTVPVLATGILAWQLQLEGQKLKGILLMHLILGRTSAILIWIAWGLRVRAKRPLRERMPVFRLGLEAVGVAILGLTGHLGGFVEWRYRRQLVLFGGFYVPLRVRNIL